MGNSQKCASCIPIKTQTEVGVYYQEQGKEAIGVGVGIKSDPMFWGLLGLLFYLVWRLRSKKPKKQDQGPA